MLFPLFPSPYKKYESPNKQHAELDGAMMTS